VFVTAAVPGRRAVAGDRSHRRAAGAGAASDGADEWSEPARALLVSAHLAAGDQSAARVALEDCYRMLFAIGAQPDARTRMLARQLGRDDSALPTGRTAVAG
jgi:DNA-binding SARP family transcriptional activator